MTEMSKAQREAILDAYARDETIYTRSYRTDHALRMFGAIDEHGRPTFRGLVLAGVDMDAVHEQALALAPRYCGSDFAHAAHGACGGSTIDIPIQYSVRDTTPAEARTGISDRAAGALADVAELRRISGGDYEVCTMLDRIEQALRGER